MNALFLRQAIASCRCRFALLSLCVLAYLHFFNAKCIGYTPSPGCTTHRDEACSALLYSLCACFYYTIFGAQVMHLTKRTPVHPTWTALFQCTGVALLSVALVYGITRN